MQSYDKLVEKWAPVLNEESAGTIKDAHRRSVTAAILENQETALREERAQNQGFITEAAPAGANTGSIGTWDPVLISLVRRSMPNLMAYDVAGVQPMSGPTGLIFAMKSRYDGGATNQAEALFGEANMRHAGTKTAAAAGADGSGLDVTNTGGGAAALTIDSDRLTNLANIGMTTDSAEALAMLLTMLSNKWVSPLRKQL